MDPAAALANRVLERETWARQRLAAHAGRVFTVVVGPIVSSFRIEASGLLESNPPRDAGADLTLFVSPAGLPSFLADPSRWDEFVEAKGDESFASALKDLALTLPWFVEQAFAKALGPIAGQRLADAGRRLLAFPEYAAGRFGDSVASYARDEAALLARGDELRSFGNAVAEIAQRVESLFARIAKLAARQTDDKGRA